MILHKLPWAGVLLETEHAQLLIDPLGDAAPNVTLTGTPLEPLADLSQYPDVSLILVTHVHPDHFDPTSLQKAYGADILLLLPEESVGVAQKAGFTQVVGMRVGEQFQHGEITVTATHSVDGFGTPQVAWLVEADGKKVIHCGDTLWHGFWWGIARKHGPIEIACLPVNSPLLEVPGLDRQSEVEAVLSPEQAVDAAYLLGVKAMIPIHFGTFHNPPFYIETQDLAQRLLAAGEKRAVEVRMLNSGESMSV
ncbi:MBL fold metallo-hydrolase [Brevibacillus migulae]|uniref:MBL fold metallo-hydrolase n=1 Tax=Brevibacillus migulae TaxID=1644114 RepID=UPI00106DF5FC|nr:MBL fold metallo-hydrolase [Brevibacillus migulae]